MCEKKISLTEVFENKAKSVYNLDKACELLNGDFPIRKSGDEIKRLLEKKGVDEFTFRKKLGRENAANAGNWLKSTAIRRDSAVKILLALEVDDIDCAEEFVMSVCGDEAYAFYARDYKDLIYMFCLQNSLGFEKVDELVKKYGFLDKYNAEAEDIEGEKRRLTNYLRLEYNDLETEEDLDKFFTKNRDYFGNFNRTAYKKFIEYYDKHFNSESYVKSNDTMGKRESGSIESYTRENVTIKDICESVSILNQAKREGLSLIQKIISKDDPKDKRLGAIINKQENVPRKYLILFYLVWRGDIGSPESSILDMKKSLLNKCGMPHLDSRNPFDWMVMNSLYATAKRDYGTIDRMKDMAQKVFDIDSEEE